MVKFSPIFHFFFLAIFLSNWNSAQAVTLNVTAVLNEPYVTLKDSLEGLTGNDQYEGYAVDLIHAICEVLGFEYTIHLVQGNRYGNLNKISKEWDGMIRELVEKRADIAIGDLTITSERADAVDFATSFMNTGISVLYRRPTIMRPKLFSFLEPFSADVWIYMATAYVGVSVLLWVLARYAPPSSQQQDKVESQSSLINCMFLPRGLPTRVVTAIWWFFVLIMVSLYSGNCGAFVTNELRDSSIESVDDLARQTKVKYGVVDGGSTASFFHKSNNPTYEEMWSFMESLKPSAFVSSYAEGIQRVINENGNYAFLMESVAIEYIVERNCELTQIGELLDSKNYGFALRKNSPYLSQVNGAISKLREQGTLYRLKMKWWKAGLCTTDESDTMLTLELGLDHVGGVFVFLIIGLSIACIVAVGEFFVEKLLREAKK